MMGIQIIRFFPTKILMIYEIYMQHLVHVWLIWGAIIEKMSTFQFFPYFGQGVHQISNFPGEGARKLWTFSTC